MKSEWKITSNYIEGEKLYAVYRLVNTREVDHSGNREYASGYTEDRAEAQAIADRLNGKEAT